MRLYAVLLGSVLALAGCGGDDGGDSAGACAFLNKDEVEDALGGPFAPPKRNEGPSGSAVEVCSWYAEAGKDGRGFIQLTVSNFPGKGRRQFDNQRKITPRAKDISEVGEGAFASGFGRNTKVTTLKGDRLVEVLSVDEGTATELAKAVLDRV
ncbi:MAG: hypothetical protein ACR2ML_06970 [Solirubrobacteraceae bacterium]